MRLDQGQARLGAVGVHGEAGDRKRPADRTPRAVVERDSLEVVQMRFPVVRHQRCTTADHDEAPVEAGLSVQRAAGC
jgi:hypothetical protein